MASTPLKYLHQYFTTTLNVGGGIDASQTTGIVIQSVTGLDIAKPGVACLTYADPINTSTAEWITYTSINGSNELQGVTRGAEGFSAKTHANGAVVAFPLSESHINNINAMFDATGLDVAQIATPANPDSGRNKLYFKSGDKAYTLTSGGTEAALATEGYVTTALAAVTTDGWTADSDTWVYVSASSFKVAGKDVTSRFTVGTRLKFTQTTVKYAVVTASAFSTDTTVTIAVNTDYTIANAAITSPYYSYQLSPAGYPAYFAYTPTYAGFSSDPTTGISRFRVVGRSVLVNHAESATGVSNATSFTISLPITAKSITGGNWCGMAQVRDNGTVQTNAGLMTCTSGGTVINVYKDYVGSNWTNTGNKQLVYGFLEYEI